MLRKDSRARARLGWLATSSLLVGVASNLGACETPPSELIDAAVTHDEDAFVAEDAFSPEDAFVPEDASAPGDAFVPEDAPIGPIAPYHRLVELPISSFSEETHRPPDEDTWIRLSATVELASDCFTRAIPTFEWDYDAHEVTLHLRAWERVGGEPCVGTPRLDERRLSLRFESQGEWTLKAGVTGDVLATYTVDERSTATGCFPPPWGGSCYRECLPIDGSASASVACAQSCESDADCVGALGGGRCVEAPAGAPPFTCVPEDCASDDDCGSGFRCDDEVCTAIVSPVSEGRVSCEGDADCEGGRVCAEDGEGARFCEALCGTAGYWCASGDRCDEETSVCVDPGISG